MAGLNLFTNNAATTLASGITSIATSLTVATSTGGLFPSPTAGQYFYATLQNTTGTVIEIVKVTARTTDTFTIVRAQDGTTASAFSAGDKVELRCTAADLTNFGQLDSTNTWAQAQTFSSPIAATSGGTGTGTYTTGDIIYASATNTLSKLAIGTSGQALTVSAGGVPTWTAAGGSTTLSTTSFTATAGQTSFTVSYTPSLLQGVYRNGVKLDPADYTATSGTAVVLSAAAALNDNIQVQYFTALSTLATPLGVALGGTGATTLTGIVKGSGTSAFTAATAGTDYVAPGGALGTPSSGTLTNATGLPLSTGVTGTLPVANGGTGMTSATAYALLAGGTTSTGAHQSLASVGTSGQVLTSNGAGALPTWQAAAGGGGLGGQTVFTSSGTFTIPTGKTVVKVTVVGGGGGTGGNQSGFVVVGSGGAGGGSAVKYLTGLTPGNTLTVTVGAGGTAGASGSYNTGGTGGTSSVASGTQTITTISATGGSGGTTNNVSTTNQGGTGGSGSNGDYNISGGNGSTGSHANAYIACYGQFSVGLGGGGGGSLLAPRNKETGTASASGSNATSPKVNGIGYGGGASSYQGPDAGFGQPAQAGATGSGGIVIFEY